VVATVAVYFAVSALLQPAINNAAAKKRGCKRKKMVMG